MTLKEVISAIKNITMAQDAAVVIRKETAQLRREFIGKSDIETMPTGARIECVIVEIDWVESYGIEGDWAIRVIYSAGTLKGQFSWTSDKVLDLMGSR